MFSRLVSLIGIVLFCIKCGVDSACCDKKSLNYLEAAVDSIDKAKHHFPSANCDNALNRNPVDCSDLFALGYKKSGIYTIWPQSRLRNNKPLEVYCDMKTDGGGWTVIQRRGEFGRDLYYFYKDWKSYKVGFGDVDKDFWLGNDNIFGLTNQRLYSVRFDLKDMHNVTTYAHYDTFWIDDENNKYTLRIADYRGNAGDSMIEFHNNRKFSTKDQDNAWRKEKNCAEEYKGGWWYNAINCYASNLNGLIMNGSQDYKAIHWNWTQEQDSLQSSEIKIRPRGFKLTQEVLNNTPKWKRGEIELSPKYMHSN